MKKDKQVENNQNQNVETENKKTSTQIEKDILAYKDKARKRKENRMKEMRKKYRIGIGLAAAVVIIALIVFIAVKWANRPYKVDYDDLEINGKWYAANIDDVGEINVSDDKFEYKDSTGAVVLSGDYDISEKKIEIKDKTYDFEYFDEAKEGKNVIDNEADFSVNKYFIIKIDGNDVYCSDSLEDAEDQADSNLDTNAYYKKADMFDNSGFAVDEEDRLLAYIGDDEEITIPSQVKLLGENAFSKDYDRAMKIKTINVPSNIQAIEPYAFSFTNASKITIAQGVGGIKTDAFSDCDAKEFYFPDSMGYIEPNIFGENAKLKGVKLNIKKDSNVDNYFKNANLQGDYEIVYR